MCHDASNEVVAGSHRSACTSTVWDDLFDTDQAAKAEFHRAVAEEGLARL